jgi:hypothetical protein
MKLAAYEKKKLRQLRVALCLLIACLLGNWWFTHKITPKLEIVPQVPTSTQVRAMALGDEQAYFRILALQMQMTGDTWGRFTPLKDYNYQDLQKWFYLLDELDAQSNFTPSIAAYYYSNTQRTSDVIYITEYLERHYDRGDHNKKWWWLSQAAQLANYRLKNRPLALRLAYKLANSGVPNLPRWIQQMPAFILEKMGEYEQAMVFMREMSEHYKDFSQGEINFMNYFIKNRLGFINERLNVKPNRKADQDNLDDGFGVK